jgi:hypothetical protein
MRRYSGQKEAVLRGQISPESTSVTSFIIELATNGYSICGTDHILALAISLAKDCNWTRRVAYLLSALIAKHGDLSSRKPEARGR